jgi:hypothetical protein
MLFEDTASTFVGLKQPTLTSILTHPHLHVNSVNSVDDERSLHESHLEDLHWHLRLYDRIEVQLLCPYLKEAQ